MSAAATAWAWEQAVKSPGRKLVLLALADRAAPCGVAWPSKKRLAEDVALSERQVQRHLSELEEAGLVVAVPATRPNGSTTSNLYLLAYGDYNEQIAFVDDTVNSHVVGSRQCLPGGESPVSPPETSSLEPPREEPAAPKPVKRNIVWEIVVEHFGEPATTSERGDFGKTVKEITDALLPLTPGGVSEVRNEPTIRDEVGRRVRAMGDYRSHRSLRTRWAQLGADAHTDPPQVEVDERSAARTPCECIAAGTAPVPDPDCPDCGGTGIADWVS